MTGIPLSRAFWIGLLKATGSTTQTAMPLALPEMAVFIASTISETTDFSEPVHCDVVPSRACASSMPYCVGTKNGFVVTWLTKTKFHSGVFGKLPPDPPEPPPWLACCAASRLHPASNSPADASALPARNCLRPSLRSSVPDPRSLISTPVYSSPTTLPLPALLYQYLSVSSAPVGCCSGTSPLVPPEAHPGRSTAVHVQDMSCNEVSRIGDEEGNSGGDVFGVSDAAPGYQGVAEFGRVVRDVEVAGDLYDPWADGVDPDLAVGELYGELAGEGVDGALRGRVGRVVGEARGPVDRGHVDDAPASPLHYERHGPPGEEEVALHVQVKDRIVGLLVGIEEVERPGDAGVVHERIEPAEGLGCGVHGPLAVGDLAQVALHRCCLTAELHYLRDGLFRLGVGVVDGDLGPAAGELDGDALAYPYACAGDQSLLPREVAHWFAPVPAPSRLSQPSAKRLKCTFCLGWASITSSSSSTPRPGPLGSSKYPFTTSERPGAVSRTQGSAKSLKYSWMRKFVVQAARWRAAAVLIWPPTLCGAMVT